MLFLRDISNIGGNTECFVASYYPLTLTSHHPYEEVELLHCVAEGGSNESRPCQTTTEDDDWSTAKFVHEDTADWTWREKRGNITTSAVVQTDL